jgi:hypothetical protein
MTNSETEDRAGQLLAMTQRLVTLVGAEAQAVKAHRLNAATADWDEKERLVHTWRLEVSRIKADPGLLAGISAETRQALRDASLALESALESHTVALNASKTVTEGLVRSIAEEIASARSAPASYGRTGGFNTPGPRQASGLAVDAKA